MKSPMSRLLKSLLVAVALAGGFRRLQAEEIWRVFPKGEGPQDARLAEPRTLNDAYHPWTPPTTRESWDAQAARLREQVLIAAGLWPMPAKTPLEPVIHGKIDRGDYTIEKVYFASRPGHYVTGSLYRPKNVEGSVPGVLSPHGHWANGRFYDAGPQKAAEELRSGAEEFLSGAQFPLQARMVQLARMGCVVFHYDMIGYADSTAVEHRAGFNDALAELQIQNKLGLQTWNSIRALDFLISLPGVDADRVGVTGASGGGTQTFVLCAIDDRPAAAFPAVMVSTAMQGGCVCENASCLRHGVNNIALAALFAPRPMAMSGADDWTIDIETKGLPELKQVYSLFGKADLIEAVCYPQFAHNYNQVSREMMFAWFHEHLGLQSESPVRQTDFRPLTREELTVFDADHPVPADALSAADLRLAMTAESEAQFAALIPESAGELEQYRRIVGTAARVLLDAGSPPNEIEFAKHRETPIGSHRLITSHCGRTGSGEQVPVAVLVPEKFRGDAIAWFDDQGKSCLFTEEGRLTDAVGKLLDAGYAVLSADLFLTGEFAESGGAPAPVNATYPGYTFGYNRPLLSQRVRDILTVIAGAAGREGVERVHLVATGEAGPWALLATALAGEMLASTTVDLGGFSFEQAIEPDDPMLLPGGLRYGDVGGFAALAAPSALTLFGTDPDSNAAGLDALRKVYRVADGPLNMEDRPLHPDDVVAQLIR